MVVKYNNGQTEVLEKRDFYSEPTFGQGLEINAWMEKARRKYNLGDV